MLGPGPVNVLSTKYVRHICEVPASTYIGILVFHLGALISVLHGWLIPFCISLGEL